MIQAIEHLEDPRVASYAHVADHAWLTAEDLFVAEGRLVVERLAVERRFAIQSILLTPAAHASFEGRLDGVEAPIYICSQALLKTLTGFNFHRGCLALAHRGEALVPIATLASARTLVALEGVANPDNIGGIFRNALALGAEGVILDPDASDPLYRKAIRTSMGATLRVPFARMDDWPAGLVRFRDSGFTVAALTPAADAIDISAFAASRRKGPLMLVAGHEGHGLTAAAIAASDVRCRIPVDPRSDSLNVAVAVGIALAMLISV